MSGPVHFIAQFTIDDFERYHQYELGFFSILKAHTSSCSKARRPAVVPSLSASSRKRHASRGGTRPNTRNLQSIAGQARRQRWFRSSTPHPPADSSVAPRQLELGLPWSISFEA